MAFDGTLYRRANGTFHAAVWRSSWQVQDRFHPSSLVSSAASTLGSRRRLEAGCRFYTHCDLDVRDRSAVNRVFARCGRSVAGVVHTAAQPSHEWAASEPVVDFEVNALGTLYLLEATRQHSPDAAFVFTSTNKVYGDTPNALPLVELDRRMDVPGGHLHCEGIDER